MQECFGSLFVLVAFRKVIFTLKKSLFQCKDSSKTVL